MVAPAPPCARDISASLHVNAHKRKFQFGVLLDFKDGPSLVKKYYVMALAETVQQSIIYDLNHHWNSVHLRTFTD